MKKNEKKKVLVLDRGYCFKYIKSDIFDVIVVCLSHEKYEEHKKQNLNIVGCFEDQYDSLSVSAYPDDYLLHSFDSDRYLRHYCLEKRREILGKEISFWQEILDKYNPSCIVNEVVTIEFMEVMYIEAKKRNIPYFTWAIAPFAPLDFWVKGAPFDSRMQTDFWESVKENKEDRDNAIAYISKARSVGNKPFYINVKRELMIVDFLRHLYRFFRSLYWHIKKILTQSFIYEDSFYENINYLNYSWSRLFHKYDKEEYQSNYEYFFFPLHLEPEAAVEYAGYYYNDQAMLIGRIAHNLKTNQILIIKEHPQQEGVLMTKKYRSLKRRYPNLLFLPGRISSYSIYPHIKSLITLNGTAGFESWVCKRPVVVFGEVFYKDFPGISVCHNFAQLQDIVRHDNYSRVDDEEIISYVSKIQHILTHTFPYILQGKYDPKECEYLKNQIEDWIR